MNTEKSKILNVVQLIFNKFKEQNLKGAIEVDEIFTNQEDVFGILEHLEKKECLRLIKYNPSDPDALFTDLIQKCDFKFRIQDINSLNLFNYLSDLSGDTIKPFIKPLALEKIARDMGNTNTANELIDLLHECGVPKFLIIYPNTKWRMIKDIFLSLVSTLNPEAHDIFFNVLEEYCHPIRFGGDEAQAQAKQDEISNLLKYSGFCFESGKIVELNDNLKEELHKRNEAREKEFKNLDLNAFFDLFGSFNKKVPATVPATSPETKLTPISITIQNQNIQSSPNLPAVEDNERHTTNYPQDNYDQNLIFEADISKKFEIWVKGQKERKWGLRKKENGEFFVTGGNMVKLLENIGKGVITREDKENIVKTLANNLPVTTEQAKKIFFNENGKYGILEDHIILI